MQKQSDNKLLLSLASKNDTDLKFSVARIKETYKDKTTSFALSVVKGVIRDYLPLSKTNIPPEDQVVYVSYLISRYCKLQNVSKNMDDAQVYDLAMDIVIEEKDKWSVEELALFFDRLGKGEITNRKGEPFRPFDHVDRSFIEDAMDRYFETDRTQAVWALEDEIQNQYKAASGLSQRITPNYGMTEIDTKYEGTRVGSVNIPGISKPYTSEQIDALKNKQDGNK